MIETPCDDAYFNFYGRDHAPHEYDNGARWCPGYYVVQPVTTPDDLNGTGGQPCR